MVYSVHSSQRALRYLLPTLLCFGALALHTSCARSIREKVLGRVFLVKSVTFEGNESFSRKELLRHMHLGESSWIPFTPDYHFNEALLAVDAQRIEAFYQSSGFYQARVDDVSFRIDHKEREIFLSFVVREGTQAKVRKAEFIWADDSPVAQFAREAVQDLSTLQTDAPFSTKRLNDTVGALRFELMRRGHPFAKTSSRVQAYPAAKLVDVQIFLEPGPFTRVGSISFEGLDRVPEDLVRKEVAFALEQHWSPRLGAEVRDSLKAMRVFRWVSVVPGKEARDGKVDLRIRVSEADPESIRIGGALSFEAVRWQEQIDTLYTHTNLFGRLVRLDLALVTGWAHLPDPFDADAQGPVVALVPTFTKKGILEDQLVWSLRPGFGVNIADGYQFYSPSNRVGVARWLTRNFQVDVSHNLRFVDFFNVSASLDDGSSLLGRDFRDPFFLSFLELRFNAYLTEKIVDTDDGVIFEFLYDLAGGPFLGDYSFHKLEATARSYWTPFERLQFALRLGTGAIFPYGDKAGTPLNFKFYLGGPTSVRGWGGRRISPRIEECVDEDDPSTCRGIPIGGLTMVQGNFEMRLRAFWKLHVIGFVDLGDVQADAGTFRPEEWNFAAGPGLRLDSPVGVFRLDAGFRLNDPGIYLDEPKFAIYFGLGETF